MSKRFLISVLFVLSLILPKSAYAICPVCTVAVGAGLGLSRYLGIDDTISGIWVGGLVVSFSYWTVDWLKKKNFNFLKKLNEKTKLFLSFLLWIFLTYPPLVWTGLIGHPVNTVLGIDKLIFGSILGAAAFLFDKKGREVKGGQLFQFQKVIFPIASLALVSVVMYYYSVT